MQDTFEAVEFVEGSKALTALTNAEIDIQISTAKAYPRSVTEFKRTAMELATLDVKTARSMYYLIPRGGKQIEGPTIRMAEIVAYAWGNIRVGARIIAQEHATVTAQGVCFDLQRNVSASVEVKRGILKSDGKTRYDADMIRVTCQAACKIAYREAVFAVVPRSLFKDIYEESKIVSVGKGETIEQMRDGWLNHFESKGVKRAAIFRTLNVKGEEDIGLDQLIVLNGIDQAVKEGEMSVEEAFSDPDKPDPPKTAPLNDRVKNGGGRAKQPEAGSDARTVQETTPEPSVTTTTDEGTASPARGEPRVAEHAAQPLVNALGALGFESDSPDVGKWLWRLVAAREVFQLSNAQIAKVMKALDSGDIPTSRSAK